MDAAEIVRKELKQLVDWVIETGKYLMKNGIIPRPLKPHISVSGEIAGQHRRILEGENPEEVWSKYCDYFVEIAMVETKLNTTTFLHLMRLDLKTRFLVILDEVSRKIGSPYVYDFLISYFASVGALEFNFDLFTKMCDEFTVYSISKNTIGRILIPLFNFLLLDKEIKNDQFRFCIYNPDEIGGFYCTIPDMRIEDIPPNPNYIALFEPRFSLDGEGYVCGALAPYVFEYEFEFPRTHGTEFYKEWWRRVKTKNIDITTRDIEYSLMLKELSSQGNHYAKYIIQKEKLQEYLLLALRLYKDGDVAMPSVIINDIPWLGPFNSPLASMKPNEIPDYNNPYILSRDDAISFLEFWIKFQKCDQQSQSVFLHALRHFVSVSAQYIDDTLFDYYLVIEILLGFDFTSSRRKSAAIMKRVVDLLRDHQIYANSSKDIVNCLRNLRNDVGHTGRLKDENMIDLISNFPTISNTKEFKSILKEIKFFIRAILWEYWCLLRSRNLSEYVVQNVLHTIK